MYSIIINFFYRDVTELFFLVIFREIFEHAVPKFLLFLLRIFMFFFQIKKRRVMYGVPLFRLKIPSNSRDITVKKIQIKR